MRRACAKTLTWRRDGVIGGHRIEAGACSGGIAKLLLTAVLLLATIAADAGASGASRHDAVILANAYRDTVWFGSDTLIAGHVTMSMGLRLVSPTDEEVNADRASFRTVMPRTCSKGIVLLIASDVAASPRESLRTLIELLATIRAGRAMASLFPPRVSPAVYELGCFDDLS